MNKNLIPITVAALLCQASAETPAAKPVAPAPSADAYYRQGQVAEQAGDPEAARKAYQEALKLNPNHANARYAAGQLKINATSISARGREQKFGAVTVPEFKLADAALQESLDALSMIVERESKKTVTPNFVVQDPKNQLSSAKLNLNLKSMPAKAVLKYMLDQANAKARFDEHAIVIEPK
jgi:tetratricopeptide (TPR) repeat protein